MIGEKRVRGETLSRRPAVRPKPARAGRSLSLRALRVLASIGALLVGLLLWALLVRLGGYPAYILPSPQRVAQKFITLLADGSLLYHTSLTLMEVLAGLALGMAVAVILGYIIARSIILDRVLSPYLVALQAVPIIAVAPLLIIWFGFGVTSKVLVCALTVFFPVLMSTVVGLRTVEPDLVALMRSLQANRWQTFTMLEAPAALPFLLTGLKVGVTLAVIGAVVGEFVGADRGLGYLINLGRNLLDTPLMFVGIITLVGLTLLLYGLASLLEQRLLRWRPSGGEG